MNLQNTIKTCSSLLVQLAIPAILVVGVRAMTLRDGPSSASAAVPTSQTAPKPPPTEPLDTEPDEASKVQLVEAAKIARVPIARNPFVSDAFKSDDPVAPSLFLDPKTVQKGEPQITAPELRLTSIVAGREPVAVIDGRILRVGEDAAPGWKITAINIKEQTVVIEHASGLREEYGLSP